MAITPNTATEVANKQAVRANTRGGANSAAVFAPIDPASLVNAFAQASGVLRLTTTDSTANFTIGTTAAIASGTVAITAITGSNTGTSPFTITVSSGAWAPGQTITIGGITTTTGYNQNYLVTSATFGGTTILASGVTSNTVTGSGTMTNAWISGTGASALTPQFLGTGNVNTLISGLSATGSPLANSSFFINAGGANLLKSTTVDIVVPSGFNGLVVISGTTGTAPALTALTLSGTNAEAVTYPNYVGTPFATPTWIDDATVHAYPVYGVGAVVQDTTKTEQKQVRQIQTTVSETQQYDGYFTTYSGNLYQTVQKNTKRQQG